MFVLNKKEIPWNSGSGVDNYKTRLFLSKEQAMSWIEKDIEKHVKVYRGEREEGDPATCFYEKWSDYGWDSRGMWAPQCEKEPEYNPDSGGWIIGKRTVRFVKPNYDEGETDEQFKAMSQEEKNSKDIDWLNRHWVIELVYWGHEIDVEKELAERKSGVLPETFAEDPYK